MAWEIARLCNANKLFQYNLVVHKLLHSDQNQVTRLPHHQALRRAAIAGRYSPGARLGRQPTY